MKFTEKELDIVCLTFEDPMFDDNYIIVDVDKQTESITISIDSNNDAELIIKTRDDYLKYQFYTTGCITEIGFLTREGEPYAFKTVWNEEHNNFNTFEYITDIDEEVSTLWIVRSNMI